MIHTPAPPGLTSSQPFRAVWAMMVGFFLIVVDSTIVAVANPVIKEDFGASYEAVIWVTSAYLLVFAGFLLIGGRLGDRFGPKNVYLAGLALFTASSLWCGLAESIEMLIGGRVAQGVGAALLTPQTLSFVTRIFPPERRGVAMSIWGTTAGLGMLVGPLAGGVLVDGLGWEWIFLINVPIGVLGLGLAALLLPMLPVRRQHFDLFGVVLSCAGISLIVFGLQEGNSQGWRPGIWAVIAVGIALLAAFVRWQSVQRAEPLIPLTVFGHRDFALSNVGIALISFAVVASAVPLMFYLQQARGLSASHAGLMTTPMAVATAVLAPFVGRLADRVHPRAIVGPGFTLLAIALAWLSLEMDPDTPVWRLVLPLTVIGVAGAMTWEPLAVTASRTLPPELAGAGSAVYNTIRQLGAVLGSASIAALMTALVGPGRGVALLPDSLKEPFAEAMSRSMLLPAFAAGLGAVAALFFVAQPPKPADRHAQGAYQPKRNVSTAP